MLAENADGTTSLGFADRMPGLGISLVGMNIDSAVISAQLRALLDRGEAVIRTRPVGVALNKTEVSIETVDELPYVDLNDKGKLNVQKKSVGVKLQVRPTIVPDYPGAVQLDISNIEISSGSRFMTLQNVNRPVISLSRTHTKVTLREGETFVIGGLKTRRRMVEKHSVPILGRIPIIKWLFTSHREVVRNMDVLFFITPNILEPGENFLLPYDFENRQYLGAENPSFGG
jgi:type II secretory pathway component GspD/PulD (secretin)